MKTMMNRVFLGLCLAGAMGLAPVQAEMVKSYEGWKIYTSTCFLCHGVTGKGDGPLAQSLKLNAADFTARRERLAGLSDRELMREIQGTRGHLEGMPGWGTILPEPQIDAVGSYVRYLSRAIHPLEGNPEKGRELYQRYCVSCHGTSGKGDGFMTSFVAIRPADHTNAALMDRKNNQYLFKEIMEGERYMPGWAGILNEEEVKALVSYIRLLSYQ